MLGTGKVGFLGAIVINLILSIEDQKMMQIYYLWEYVDKIFINSW